MIFGDDLTLLQAPVFDGHSLHARALGEDGLIPAEVGVRLCHIAETFMVAMVIMVLDKRLDLGFEVTGQK